MNPQEILNLRLSNQLLLGMKYKNPADVVSHMCAMQAQDFLGSLWAVGLRTESCTEKNIEQAIIDRTIVRTWPMRGTLNYVAPADVRWMLKLMAPRILSVQKKRMKRDYDLDEEGFAKCREILIRSLQGGKQLARNDVYRVLGQGGVPATGQRGLHIIWYLAQEGLLCFGPREGKQPSFILLDEWIPNSKSLSHEESLAEITFRYFSSRGPATLADFIWWTGLTSAAAKNGIELAKPKLFEMTADGKTYWMSPDVKPIKMVEKEYLLLPPFDEYLIAYADRSLMLGNYTIKDVVPFSNGMFFSIIVESGRLIGTWKRTIQKKSVNIELKPWKSLDDVQEKGIAEVVKKYEEFLGL